MTASGVDSDSVALACSGAERPGLVSSSTSQNIPPGTVVLDPKKSRARRLRRAVLTAAVQIERQWEDSKRRYRRAFVTVTYAPGASWAADDISKLTDHYRKWAKRKGVPISIVWIGELGSKTGRFHYHLQIWLPRGFTPPKPDKQGWWRKGLSNCQWSRSAAGYLAKYAGKGSDGAPGQIPKGARLYGVCGLTGSYRALWFWSMLPKWIQRMSDDPLPTKREKGGWWSVGPFRLRSPWEYLGLSPDGSISIVWRGWALSRDIGRYGEEWEHDIEMFGFVC